MSALDDLDRKIVNALIANSRLSYRQISRKIGVSVVTVMKRARKLEKSGIIKGYTATLDYEKLGYDLQVIIDVRVSKGKLFDVENMIANRANVVTVYDVTGSSDVLLVCRFKTRKQLDDFVKYIQTIPNVIRTHTRLILNTIKEGAATV
ncbi:MAG: Lrp/AsnC family transcriptional regulator [Candidatus Aenigmarchaeota archaeon]|nr:Lrp/AsnC family transcriptional regulator [Candidatus Aenigmarchaeota archaeon]